MASGPVMSDALELYDFLADRALGRVVLGSALLAALGAVGGGLTTVAAFLAYNVVAALTGARWDTELARTMNYVPNKAKLAGAVAGEEGAAAMAAGAAQGRATPSTPEWAAVEADNPIKGYMTKVLTGADPATEARRAARRITRALAVTS